ncbi:MAG: hypothetical protein JSV88_13435 [Candidatus Aminicenantes bacterium]|nr:MAG: hypothetical protein JSV88_13435 [Candidatus Aminicenantes bacterium]
MNNKQQIIESEEKKSKRSRWELAAERLKSEGFLKGQGEEAKKLIRDFRENF